MHMVVACHCEKGAGTESEEDGLTGVKEGFVPIMGVVDESKNNQVE